MHDHPILAIATTAFLFHAASMPLVSMALTPGRKPLEVVVTTLGRTALVAMFAWIGLWWSR